MGIAAVAGAGGFKADVSRIGDGHIARTSGDGEQASEGIGIIGCCRSASPAKEQTARVGDGDILIRRGFHKHGVMI